MLALLIHSASEAATGLTVYETLEGFYFETTDFSLNQEVAAIVHIPHDGLFNVLSAKPIHQSTSNTQMQPEVCFWGESLVQKNKKTKT